MNKSFNEHECDHLPDQGVYIEFSEDVPAWKLYIQREATDSDLEGNHYLETEGKPFGRQCWRLATVLIVEYYYRG